MKSNISFSLANRIEDEGAKYLAEVLKNNSSIITLGLGGDF